MAAAQVASASAQSALTAEEKWENFLEACDRLFDSENEWPPSEELLHHLRGTTKEKRSHLQSITLGSGDATILAGYNAQYSSKEPVERLYAVLQGEHRFSKAQTAAIARNKSSEKVARQWLRTSEHPSGVSRETVVLSKETRGLRATIEKGGIINREDGGITVTRTVIVKNSTVPTRIRTQETVFSFLHRNRCRKHHVAQVSIAAAILKEYNPEKDINVRIIYFNSETETGNIVTWDLTSAAALVDSMRQAAGETLGRLREENFFLPIQGRAWTKFEQRKRRRRKREARELERAQASSEEGTPEGEQEQRKRKKKKCMSHLSEETEGLSENKRIKELFFTQPRLLTSSVREGQENIIRATCRARPGRGAWKRKKKKKRRRPQRKTLRRIVKKLFHNHSSFLNDLLRYATPIFRQAILTRIEKEQEFSGNVNLPWKQDFYYRILQCLSSLGKKKYTADGWDAYDVCNDFTNAVSPPISNDVTHELNGSAVNQMVALLATRLKKDFKNGLCSNAPLILAKLRGMDAPQEEGEIIKLHKIMNDLKFACADCGLLSSTFSVDDMDDNGDDDAISSSSLEALLRASVVGARILEDADRRVPAILLTANVATEPAFMTIDTNSFVSMIGNVVPSIEAGNLQEKRALWERFFTLPKFKRDEFFGYSVQTDGYSLRFTSHRHVHYDGLEKQEKDAVYTSLKEKAENLSRATKMQHDARGAVALHEAEENVKEARKNYFAELDGNCKRLKTNLKSLKPGKRYTDFAKCLCDDANATLNEKKEALKKWLTDVGPDGKKIVLRSVDPNVKTMFAAADLGSDANDIRDTGIKVETKEFHAMCGTKLRAELMANERKKYMAEFDASEAANYGRSVDLGKATQFGALVRAHMTGIQRMNRSMKIRKLRARKFAAKQRAMAVAANKLTKCKDDEKVVLLYGKGSEKDGFTGNGIKGNIFGPAKKLAEYITRHKLATVIWVSEFRTSMLDLQGKLVYHPQETRPKVITKKRHKCKLKDVELDTDGMHPLNTFGCRCRCSSRGCDEKRTQGTKCDRHFKSYNIHGLSIDSEKRAWNRDMLACINIGLLFIAHVLRIEDLGLWSIGTHVERDVANVKSWRDILGDEILTMLNVSVTSRRHQH